MPWGEEMKPAPHCRTTFPAAASKLQWAQRGVTQREVRGRRRDMKKKKKAAAA
jgi:hypothetical protein